MRSWSAAWLGVLALAAVDAGCGTVHQVADGAAESGAGDGRDSADGAGQDRPADGGGGDQMMMAACDPTRPFGAPTPLAGFNTASSDDAVSLSRDGLTAYLSSNRPGGVGGYDIWVATRATPSQQFSTPRVLEGVNTTADERGPVTSRDGLQLFFSSSFQSSGVHDIRIASRPSTLAAFSASAPLAGINTSSDEASLSLALEDTAVFFFSDRAGGLGQYDVYAATLGAAGVSSVRGVAELNSTNNDAAPVATPDGLVIFFSSNRPAAGAAGGNDIWTARRSSVSDGFGAPQLVTELNSPNSDAVTWVSPDGCTVYVQSDRPSATAGSAGYDLYEATRGR
jgi:hypothetical protein